MSWFRKRWLVKNEILLDPLGRWYEPTPRGKRFYTRFGAKLYSWYWRKWMMRYDYSCRTTIRNI